MSQTIIFEPDLIAATENVMPELNTDLILAKNFLKQQSAATGDSLYDHLVDVVQKVLTQKPPDVVDNFEHYSWEVKQEKFRPNYELSDVYLEPAQLATVNRVKDMFELVASKATKLDDFGEEEQELDLEEDSYKPKIQDLIDHNYYFREGGYGLPASECYAVYISLLMLGIKEPVSNVRFFGKIFGTKANYYIAETDVTVEELDRRIREFDMKDMPGEGEGEEEKNEQASVNEQAELSVEGEEKEVVSKEPVPPKLPPEPVSTWQPPPPIPAERPGQGVNKKVYWVCHRPGEPWICLPDLTPNHIRVARLTARCMTGDLDAEVITFPPFEGTEKDFLHAQIVRIAAATSISPQGFYTFGSGEEEEDLDIEEGTGDMAFNPNPFYQGHTIKDLLNSDMTYWVHHGRHILPQGRTIWWNPNVEMDEALDEEDEEAPPPTEPETGPSLFTPLSDDARIEGLNAWSARISSQLCSDRALVVVRSNLWPGAVAYATNGKKSECMYVGWGLKNQSPNYSPFQLPKPQDEYTIGPEVMEMADPTFADEEAFRIAHLPPPPPTEALGEGEGFGEEEEDDDEED